MTGCLSTSEAIVELANTQTTTLASECDEQSASFPLDHTLRCPHHIPHSLNLGKTSPTHAICTGKKIPISLPASQAPKLLVQLRGSVKVLDLSDPRSSLASYGAIPIRWVQSRELDSEDELKLTTNMNNNRTLKELAAPDLNSQPLCI
ncbi:hypothetical protein FNV43_RR19382 [Rhamnella rubrinervis]|uniref:Uncharacterized protein n=1 Tax=Rhamnella rubrinervis TaxID=2594499 RepID=A0A8K0DXN9_9ROSA|nr:hypothetical protein FNV43_RR19382 [Rhamnella rubrinervis]